MTDVRLPYAACRGEGEHACVIGPNNAIVVECFDTPFESGLDLAASIAAHLNDRDDNHCCNDRANCDRAQLFLKIVTANGLREPRALELVSYAIDEAGIKFVRRRLADMSMEVPF